MAISREILEKHLLTSKQKILDRLGIIKAKAANDYRIAKGSVYIPDWVKIGINRQKRPEALERSCVEEMTVRSVRRSYLKHIFSAIYEGNLVAFQEGLEALKHLNQEHPGIGYDKMETISSNLLKEIHRNTTHYYGDPLNKEEAYLASNHYQQHIAMLLLLIEYKQGPILKCFLDVGHKAFDHRQSDYLMKIPDETRIFAEKALEGIEKDIKKQQEPAQTVPVSQSVSLLPAFQKAKEQKTLVEESIQPQKISPGEQLFQAIDRGDLGQVRKILGSAELIDINFSVKDNRGGTTPLIHALDLEHLEIAQLLLEKGADPWKKNNIRHSALHALMMVHKNMNGSKFKIMMEILNKLLSDKNIQKEINVVAIPDGRTPYALALCYPDSFDQTRTLLEALTKAGAEYGSHRSLWAACLSGRTSLLKLKYMEKLFPKEFTTQKLRQASSYFDNKNILEAAVGTGHFEVVQYIFEKDKKLWLEIANQKPSILHKIFSSAFFPNRPEMIKFFLAEGVDPAGIDGLGRTAFDRIEIWKGYLMTQRKDCLTLGHSQALVDIEKEFQALEAIRGILTPKLGIKYQS